MKARTQASHPRIDHCFSVITTKENGIEHRLLPARLLTSKLLNVEVALSTAILLLDASTAQSKENKDICFSAYDCGRSLTERETQLPSGETQHWSSRPVHTRVNPSANRVFDGTIYGPRDDRVEHEINRLLAENAFTQAMKPYIAGAKALLRAFRLLASAAPKSFESRRAFVKRQRCASDLEADGQGEFGKYLSSCQEVVCKRGFEPGFQATFNRFVAVWMGAPAEAKSVFIFAL